MALYNLMYTILTSCGITLQLGAETNTGVRPLT
jgi:hypothetical protein